MTGIPPHRDPQTVPEREIAQVMIMAHRLYEEIRRQAPDLPPTAISTALINYGTQVGCRHTDPVTVAEYLRGVAGLIAPTH